MGDTPLITAARAGDFKEVKNLLSDETINVNAIDVNGRTALI